MNVPTAWTLSLNQSNTIPAVITLIVVTSHRCHHPAMSLFLLLKEKASLWEKCSAFKISLFLSFLLSVAVLATFSVRDTSGSSELLVYDTLDNSCKLGWEGSPILPEFWSKLPMITGQWLGFCIWSGDPKTECWACLQTSHKASM